MTNPIFPAEANPNPIDEGVTIGHVHLKAADLSKIEQFYVDTLGFSVMARYPNALFIAAGHYHHHLAFNTWESEGGTPPPAGSPGLYHVAIKYPSKKTLADALMRLNEAHYRIDGLSDHGTQLALYLRDPEQNGVELYWDRPEAEWPLDAQGNIVFTNEAFDVSELLQAVAHRD